MKEWISLFEREEIYFLKNEIHSSKRAKFSFERGKIHFKKECNTLYERMEIIYRKMCERNIVSFSFSKGLVSFFFKGVILHGFHPRILSQNRASAVLAFSKPLLEAFYFQQWSLRRPRRPSWAGLVRESENSLCLCLWERCVSIGLLVGCCFNDVLVCFCPSWSCSQRMISMFSKNRHLT